MVLDRNKNKLLKINIEKLRKEMIICARKQDTKWSKIVEFNGISSGWMQNCVYAYGRREGDQSGVYGYGDAERFKKICELFKLNPSDFCEEWEEYCKKYEKKQPEIKEAEQLTLAVESLKKAETDVELLKVMKEISGNLAEINANLVRLGNVQMQILEKMQKPLPAARPAAVSKSFL